MLVISFLQIIGSYRYINFLAELPSVVSLDADQQEIEVRYDFIAVYILGIVV